MLLCQSLGRWTIVAVLYDLRSPLRMGGDEADIAAQLDVPRPIIEIPLALAFALCPVLGLRQLATWRVRLKWLETVLLGSVATGLPMALADGVAIVQVDADHPWFRAILGYSLPIVVLNGLALLGLWIWVRWQEGRATESQCAP